jgi:hypothetical protein
MTIALDLEQYLALISLARLGADTPEKKRVLESFLVSIDAANKQQRYTLQVQWQELNTPLPPTTDFPAVWPPNLRATVERTDRPIAKSDVMKTVAARSNDPTNILVTKDPAGIVGWTRVEDYFSGL